MVSMMRLSPDGERVDLWRKRVSHYRKILQAHSGSFHSAKSAHARLDVLLQGINFDKSQADDLHTNIYQFDSARTNIVETCEADMDVLEKSGLDIPSPDSTAGYRMLPDRMEYDINIDMDWFLIPTQFGLRPSSCTRISRDAANILTPHRGLLWPMYEGPFFPNGHSISTL